jgi:hypothetical protein
VAYGSAGLTFGTLAVRNAIIHHMGLPEYVKTDWDNKFRQEKHKVRPGLWTVANEGREDLPNNAIKVFLR